MCVLSFSYPFWKKELVVRGLEHVTWLQVEDGLGKKIWRFWNVECHSFAACLNFQTGTAWARLNFRSGTNCVPARTTILEDNLLCTILFAIPATTPTALCDLACGHYRCTGFRSSKRT